MKHWEQSAPPPPPKHHQGLQTSRTGGWDRPPEHLLHHWCLFGFQDVVCKDPGHGHLNGELDPSAHCQLQKELSEPQLRKVTALLQRLLRDSKDTTLIFYKQKRLQRAMQGSMCQALSPGPRRVDMSMCLAHSVATDKATWMCWFSFTNRRVSVQHCKPSNTHQ